MRAYLLGLFLTLLASIASAQLVPRSMTLVLTPTLPTPEESVGDRDFNDLVVQLDFTSASGHGWLV